MLLANTPKDARDVMIQGPSGIMNICPPWNRPDYEPSKLTLTWPNGFTAVIRSANNPETVRGPEQGVLWADELAAWPTKKARLAWDNAMFGLRIGNNPQACVTTTPKPLPLLLEIHDAPTTVVTVGSTYENADNLAEEFLDQILSKYEGTSLGRQEIHAEILSEIEGALWTRAVIDASRVKDYPDLVRIVTGVDPSGGVDEIGIVTGALGVDGHLYFLNDASLKASPGVWGEAVVNEFLEQEADLVVGENNYGGEMVQHTIETAAKSMDVGIRYASVHASRGKAVRAHPVAALFEQNRAHMVGTFPQLEGEMTSWVEGEPSPNRMDAMVWVAHELMPVGYRASSEIGI